MLRSTGRTSTQPPPSSQDPAFSTAPEVRRLNPTRSLRRKPEATARPRRISAQRELAGPAHPDVDIVVSIPMGALGADRRSLDSPNQHHNFNETSPNHTVSGYSFPPMSEHHSGREKRQNKQMEEFDTIIVRGKNSIGTIGAGALQSVSQNSIIIPPPPVGGRRSSRNSAIGTLNGGNSGRSSRNSDGRSVTSANSSLRRVKTNDDSKGFTGSATGHLENPTISSSRDAAAGVGQLPQSLPQYSQAIITTVPPSSIMEYNVSTQENSANGIPSGPQEGIMKMEAESISTPQWSETKTKVPPSMMSHPYAEN